MKILLFGISNVGKTTTGSILAKKLGYEYYDLDDEVKTRFKITLEEFVTTTSLEYRDEVRVNIIKDLVNSKDDFVLAVTPISYANDLKEIIKAKDVLCIELYDTVESVFSRLVFSDENDNLYFDDDYLLEHSEHYLREINEDFNWYGYIYKSIGIENRYFMNGHSPEDVVQGIIIKYDLNSK